MLAYDKLILQHEVLIKCSNELIAANKQLLAEHKEKEDRAIELSLAKDSLEKSQQQQKEHIQGLEKMLFMISHKIRQPIAHILGLAHLFDNEDDLPQETKQILGFMRESALSLDALTRELSVFIHEKKIDSENVI